jgi:hypothetical protein
VVVVRHERDRIPPDPERLRVLAPDPLPLEEEPLGLEPTGDVPREPPDPAGLVAQVLEHHHEVAARTQEPTGRPEHLDEGVDEPVVVVHVAEVAGVLRVDRREPGPGAPAVDGEDAAPALREHVPVGRARQDEVEPPGGPFLRGPAGQDRPGVAEDDLRGSSGAPAARTGPRPGEAGEPRLQLDAGRGAPLPDGRDERGAGAGEGVEDGHPPAGEEPHELAAERLGELRGVAPLLGTPRGRRVDEPGAGRTDPLAAREVVQPFAGHPAGTGARVKSVWRAVAAAGRARPGARRDGPVRAPRRGPRPDPGARPPAGAPRAPPGSSPPPSSAGPGAR